MGQAEKATFVVVGLGGMGTFIAQKAMGDGHQFIGGIDVGEAIGKPLSEFVDHPATPDDVVAGSMDELIAKAGKPDVAIVTASIPLEEEAVISADLLERGINVLTLEPAMFEGDGPIAERLDAAGKAGGATILATGVQDTWWVHLPAVAAAATSDITEVRFDDLADISFFPPAAAAYEAGIGLGPAEWEEFKAGQLAAAPVQGGPLRELARLLGFTPGPLSYEITPIVQDVTVPWSGAESEVPAGEISGVSLEVVFPTEEGATFTGRLRYLITPGGPAESINTVTITGATKVILQFPELEAWTAVALGLVRRIGDVIAEPPGLVRVRDLAPSRYVQA